MAIKAKILFPHPQPTCRYMDDARSWNGKTMAERNHILAAIVDAVRSTSDVDRIRNLTVPDGRYIHHEHRHSDDRRDERMWKWTWMLHPCQSKSASARVLPGIVGRMW